MKEEKAIETAMFRHKQVINGLKDDHILKTISSAALWLWATISEVFMSPAEPIFLLIILLIIDWYTGIQRAKKDGEEIRSLGLRQSFIKATEYFIGLLIFSAISNIFGKSELQNWVGEILRFAKNIDWFAYFYVIITEAKSINENLSGKKGRFSKILKKLEDRIWKEE